MPVITIRIGDDCGVVVVEPAGNNCLRATMRCGRLANVTGVIARVRRVFDLAADPVMIGLHLSQDPLLAPRVAARPGLRVPGAWDGFELAVRAILGQRLTTSSASALLNKLVSGIGVCIANGPACEQGLTNVFPTPRQLLQADLAALGLPYARRIALVALATAVVADPLIFGVRRTLDEAVAQLRSLPEIDEGTAHHIAMHELREPDAFPTKDIGRLRAARNAPIAFPTLAALLVHADRWRPWRAYAAIHLWAAEHIPLANVVPHDRQFA